TPMNKRKFSVTAKLGNLFIFTQDPYIRRKKAAILLWTLCLSLSMCFFVVGNTLLTKWHESSKADQPDLPTSQVFPVRL
ncbi:MAG: hypothetical protein WCS94_21355, partial [Verrucomicrobiota bacterium]